jgi:uncharacterized membrane protein
MPAVEEQIDVAVPLATAYGVWTQFEQYPRFMEDVAEVRQVDETHLHWRGTLDGVECEWVAEVTELRPHERIVWRASGGFMNAGVISFHALDEETTRITMSADVDELDALAAIEERVRGDLQRFKEMVAGTSRPAA